MLTYVVDLDSMDAATGDICTAFVRPGHGKPYCQRGDVTMVCRHPRQSPVTRPFGVFCRRGPIAITDCVLNYHHQLAKRLAVRSHSAFTLFTDPVVHSQNRTDTAKHRKKQPIFGNGATPVDKATSP